MASAGTRFEVRTTQLPGQDPIGWIFDRFERKATCNHTHEDVEALERAVTSQAIVDNPCPTCNSSSSVSTRTIGQHNGGTRAGKPLRPVSFDALNTKPTPNLGHRHDPRLDHKVIAKDYVMPWVPVAFHMNAAGEVDRHRRVYGRGRTPVAKVRELYGTPLNKVRTRNVDGRRGDTLDIAFSVFMPKKRKRKNNDDLPLVLMMHGVPTNRLWKVDVARKMASQGYIVVTVDMLAMGDSSMVIDYEFPGLTTKSNEGFLWRFDVEYIRELMLEVVPQLRRVNRTPWRPFVGSFDDWGGGIGVWLMSMYPEVLTHQILINPIFGKGYFVIEIGAIGKLMLADLEDFMKGTLTLPQVIIGIEKYMVDKRWRFNRWTETSYMFPYQDVDYTAGKSALEMLPNFWAMYCLAARSSWLAPYQLQPYEDDNPKGPHMERADMHTLMICGLQDQMVSTTTRVCVFRALTQFCLYRCHRRKESPRGSTSRTSRR